MYAFQLFCHDEASDHDSHGKHSIITSTIEGELCSEADENTLKRNCGQALIRGSVIFTLVLVLSQQQEVLIRQYFCQTNKSLTFSAL